MKIRRAAWLASVASIAMTVSMARQTAPTGPPDTSRPIQWLEWSSEAFARAAAESKPILLNVQARWSRASLWTDEKTFTDPEVVRLVNEKWIPVRVDRDRRPDIDSRYQIAVEAINDEGAGWPLTGFLFDSGEILYGGSYIRLEDRIRGKWGLRTLLGRVAELYATKRETYVVSRALANAAFEREKGAARAPEISPALIDEIGKEMLRLFDREHGGFGPSPRYLTPYAVELAATIQHRSQDPAMLDAMLGTLRGMEQGAIYDRLSGGFHRLATDAAWRLPEFEKLLSLNAPILLDYLLAYEATSDVDLRIVAEKTTDYLLGPLRDPAGGFFVGQWAASSWEEPKGLYYSWAAEEYGKTVPAGREQLGGALFNITPQGEFILGPPPRSLLYLAMSRKDAAGKIGSTEAAARAGEAEILEALSRARASRQAPPVERAIYVDSCSSAVIALLEAHQVLGRDDARDGALAALDRLLAAVPQGAPLQHRVFPPPEAGYDPTLAQDHMMLARAALSGYETTGRKKYLASARDLVERAVALFWDGEGGGFFDIAVGPNAPGYLSIRRRQKTDTAYPSLNSMAARVLDRLALLTGEKSYHTRAESCLKSAIPMVRKPTVTDAELGLAIESHLRPSTRYVVVGREDDAKAGELTAAARLLFDPGKIVTRLEIGRDDEEIARLGLEKGAAYAVICRLDRCSAPARDVSSLKGMASAFQGRAPGPGIVE